MFKIGFIFTLVAFISACSGSSSKDEDMPRYYVVEVDRGAIADTFAENRVLYLHPVKFTSQFKQRDIVFKVGENEYQSQYPHQFYNDPEDIFTDQLQRWLQKSGLFTQVVTTDISQADMVLETAVTALYGDARQAFTPAAVLEMQFFLSSENETGEKIALFQTGLRVDVDIESTTPANVVKGWKEGAQELFWTVEDDLSGFFSKLTP
jgi:ABC-type uncharacterized transport system auxiliary subunit